jgi:tRNA-dihydrouridine synthase B
MRIGSHRIEPGLILAPMAGITDRPFRLVCRELGAGYAVSEMTAANPELWDTPKSLKRMDHAGEPGPIGVQLAGADPEVMALAARHSVERGAEIIDINMGCPAKKVCKVWAGSALLRDEALVARILAAVVQAVDVPVTLKIRTGWDSQNQNALEIARIAADQGVRALTVHGRTRDMRYEGEAEHETVAAIKAAVSIPVIANGDIDSADKAVAVLERTGADALMIGRAAQGNPWIFREVAHFLATGLRLARPDLEERRDVTLRHVRALHEFYGNETGVRVARKHIGWYLKGLPGEAQFRARVNALESPDEQWRATARYFDEALGAGLLAA